MGGDDLFHFQGDGVELKVKGEASGGLDRAEGPRYVAAFVLVNDTKPRGLTPRVDAENPHEASQAEKLAISSSEMSKLAQTCWTSSWSSSSSIMRRSCWAGFSCRL